MHFTKTLTFLLCAFLFSSATVLAQTDDDDDDSSATTEISGDPGRHLKMKMGGDNTPPPTGRWYMSNSFDGAILSTSIMERPGDRRELTTLRFSMLNLGYHFNYDFDEHFGIFTGVGIKNIGFIEKNGDSTTKRRVYTIGAPLGFKLGNLRKRHYGFIGGGVDFPFNYREKRFVKRGDKYKFNEFWSDRTDEYMPYIFAGCSVGAGIVLKVQYYPSNFFNTGFEEDNNGQTVQPYRGYRVNLLYLSLGIDLKSKSHERKAPNPEAANEM
jgi:hypothetical protein